MDMCVLLLLLLLCGRAKLLHSTVNKERRDTLMEARAKVPLLLA